MRLNYVQDSSITNAEDKDVLSRIQQRREPAGLIALDRALLHSPPIANGWNTFLGAIRTSTTLPTSILESIICRVAVLNRAWYEWQQHLPLLLAASDVQIERDYVRAIFSQPPGTWNGNHVPSVKHALALEYTDFLTLACEVEDQMFSKMKVAFAEREIVEITATCSAYNCVSRFLLALDVGEQNGHSGLKAAIAQTEELQDDAIPASRSVAETSR